MERVYLDTPDHLQWILFVSLFVGTVSLVTDVFGMKTDKQFDNNLEDVICVHGALTKYLLSNQLNEEGPITSSHPSCEGSR